MILLGVQVVFKKVFLKCLQEICHPSDSDKEGLGLPSRQVVTGRLEPISCDM